MKRLSSWPLLRWSVAAFFLGTLLSSCSDHGPMSVAPAVPARDVAPLPMPPNAVTATLDSFPYPDSNPGSLIHRSVTTPTITAFGFYNVYGYFGPGQNALVTYDNFPSWVTVQIAFGKPVSRVRVIGNSPVGFEMKCPTRTGEVLSGRVDGYGIIINNDNWRQLSTIDLSGPGILFCTFKGWTIIENITVVPESQEPKLILTCNGQRGPDSVRVTRGGEVACTVAAEPASTQLTAVRMSFVDAAGHTIPGPTGDGPQQWSGPIVVGGRVLASGTINGQPRDTALSVAVKPRQWPRLQAVAVDSGNGDLPLYPHVIHDLAHTHPPIPSGPTDTAHVGSGPNAGWWYVRSPVPDMLLVVHISDGFKPGTPFYQLQHSGTDPVTGDPFCTKSQLHFIKQGAREHEGIVQGTNTSHVAVFRRWFANNNPQDSLEAVTMFGADAPPSWSFADEVAGAFIRISNAAAADPDQKHTNDVPPGLVSYPSVPCRPRLF